LTNLTQLWLDENQISNLFPLSGLTNLNRLWLSANNSITDIAPLISNVGLSGGDEVWLGGDPLIPSSQIDDLRAKGVTVYWP